MNTKNRIAKWKKYREEIDTNKNIHFSIVNSDEELKNMFKSIDFDIEQAYEKTGYKAEKKSSVNSNKKDVKYEVNKILKNIEKNENANKENRTIKDFSSHENDKLMNDYFQEFMDINTINEQKKQATTDLKINRINIDSGKEK